MSKQILETPSFSVTTFAGGAGRGRCIQITTLGEDIAFVQLTLKELKALVEALEAEGLITAVGESIATVKSEG